MRIKQQDNHWLTPLGHRLITHIINYQCSHSGMVSHMKPLSTERSVKMKQLSSVWSVMKQLSTDKKRKHGQYRLSVFSASLNTNFVKGDSWPSWPQCSPLPPHVRHPSSPRSLREPSLHINPFPDRLLLPRSTPPQPRVTRRK